MLGVMIRSAVVFAPIAYLIALIVERVLGVVIGVAHDAPASGAKGNLVGALQVIQANLLLLALLAIVVVVLARGYIEGSSGGVR